MSTGEGTTKNGRVTPPSTCVSLRCPPSSGTRMMMGGKSPGTLADATSTSRNRALASLPPCMAMAPRSQTTGSPVFTSVVATSSKRPLLASTAMASIRPSVAYRSTRSLSGAPLNMFAGSALVDLHQLMVPGGAEKGIGGYQGSCAHAGDHGKLRPFSRVVQADDRAGPECAAGSSARQCENVDRLSRLLRLNPPGDIAGRLLRIAVIGAERAYAHRRIAGWRGVAERRRIPG